MTLAYTFLGWNKDVVKVQAQVDWGEGFKTFRTYLIKSSGEVAMLKVLGGNLMFKPGPTPNETEFEYRQGS
jgi:hypothetical protein